MLKKLHICESQFAKFQKCLCFGGCKDLFLMAQEHSQKYHQEQASQTSCST